MMNPGPAHYGCDRAQCLSRRGLSVAQLHFTEFMVIEVITGRRVSVSARGAATASRAAPFPARRSSACRYRLFCLRAFPDRTRRARDH